MENQKIEVKQSIYLKNDAIAAELNAALTAKGVFMINVMGAPGAGKTSVIRRIVERLKEKSIVVEGDIESSIDSDALNALGITASQINTHGACHLDAPVVDSAVRDLDGLSDCVLFIENIGNLVCPAEFSIGEHIKLLVLTVTDGSDKPYKYPLAFEKADIIILNKADLLPYVDFDEAFFMAGVRALNPHAPVYKASAKSGEGFGKIVQWINEKKKKA